MKAPVVVRVSFETLKGRTFAAVRVDEVVRFRCYAATVERARAGAEFEARSLRMAGREVEVVDETTPRAEA